MDVPELPVGWAWSELGQLVEIGAQQITPSRFPDRMFNYIALEHIEQGTGRVLDVSPTPGREINSGKFVFTTQHVLYGKLRPYLRKAFAPHSEGISATDLLPLKPRCGVLDRLYLLWWLLSPQVLDYVVAKQTGVKMPRLRTGDLEKMPVPLPPVAEQRRIVAKIEALLEQSRTARQALERIPLLLQRFRQAVLSAAFRGELTERNPKDEPASALLERVRTERRRRWEAGLREQGKDPAKHKYEEPAPPHTSDLPQLPEGWVWVSLPQIGELARGKSKQRPRDDARLYGGPYPFVQTGDVRQAQGVITSYTQTYNELGLAQSRLWPKGTLCITIAANIADTAILGFDACFPDSVVGFIGEHDACDVQLVEYYLRTAQEELERTAPATAQKNINLAVLGRLAIPFPPLAEQRRIASRIHELFARADAVETAVTTARRRLDELDQAILARAFRGELVPQDPNDGPASVLLGRIRKERTP